MLNASTRLHVFSEPVAFPLRELCPRQLISLVLDDLQPLCARFSTHHQFISVLIQLIIGVQLLTFFVLQSHAAQLVLLQLPLFLLLSASTRLHAKLAAFPPREFSLMSLIFLALDLLQPLCALAEFSKLLTLTFLLFQPTTAVQLLNSCVLQSRAAQQALLHLPLFLMLSAFTRLHAELASFPLHEFSPMQLIFLALDGLQPLVALAESSMLGQPSLVLQSHATGRFQLLLPKALSPTLSATTQLRPLLHLSSKLTRPFRWLITFHFFYALLSLSPLARFFTLIQLYFVLLQLQCAL
jgi:hypothetical protein